MLLLSKMTNQICKKKFLHWISKKKNNVKWIFDWKSQKQKKTKNKKKQKSKTKQKEEEEKKKKRS
jgi:DNA gyrase/topoisomerase IV subunit B